MQILCGHFFQRNVTYSQNCVLPAHLKMAVRALLITSYQDYTEKRCRREPEIVCPILPDSEQHCPRFIPYAPFSPLRRGGKVDSGVAKGKIASRVRRRRHRNNGREVQAQAMHMYLDPPRALEL